MVIVGWDSIGRLHWLRFLLRSISSKGTVGSKCLAAHVSIARLDHSIKNIFVIPGIVIPISLLPSWPSNLWRNLVLGFLATTFVACSNYVINEVLDAPFDRLHPIKRNRPAARSLVSVPIAYIQWIAMMLIGVAIAIQISAAFTIVAVVLGSWDACTTFARSERRMLSIWMFFPNY
jgi:4-hydroxybenzoate polyprenyltransferase